MYYRPWIESKANHLLTMGGHFLASREPKKTGFHSVMPVLGMATTFKTNLQKRMPLLPEVSTRILELEPV